MAPCATRFCSCVRALIRGLCLLASAASSVSSFAGVRINIREWTPEAISTDQYESTPTFTGDGREMYFMRSDRAFSSYRILRSQCASQGWSAPAPASFALPPPVNDADPFVTPDGLRLYFVSSRPFAGKKGDDLDIWMVERQTSGEWGRPLRLPEPVNSPHEELLPRVASNGRIYFGSDRPGGFGGTDIYIATPLPGGGWRVDQAIGERSGRIFLADLVAQPDMSWPPDGLCR